MYQYSDFDRQFVHQRAAQFRDQLERFQAGTLDGEAFKPLRLQNGWYIQRFAPMLRVAVPYGEINSAQLRVLARLARDFDHKEDHDTSKANAALDRAVGWDKLKPELVKIYTSNFSESELKELIAFYESPLGKKVLEKMPALTQQSAQLTQSRLESAVPEVNKLLSDMTSELAPQDKKKP